MKPSYPLLVTTLITTSSGRWVSWRWLAGLLRGAAGHAALRLMVPLNQGSFSTLSF